MIKVTHHTVLGAFNAEEKLVGEGAKSQYNSTNNTVFDAKRLMGYKFDDPQVQRELKKAHKVVRDQITFPRFKWPTRKKKRSLHPRKSVPLFLKRWNQLLKPTGGKKSKCGDYGACYFNDAEAVLKMMLAWSADL